SATNRQRRARSVRVRAARAWRDLLRALDRTRARPPATCHRAQVATLPTAAPHDCESRPTSRTPTKATRRPRASFARPRDSLGRAGVDLAQERAKRRIVALGNSMPRDLDLFPHIDDVTMRLDRERKMAERRIDATRLRQPTRMNTIAREHDVFVLTKRIA